MNKAVYPVRAAEEVLVGQIFAQNDLCNGFMLFAVQKHLFHPLKSKAISDQSRKQAISHGLIDFVYARPYPKQFNLGGDKIFHTTPLVQPKKIVSELNEACSMLGSHAGIALFARKHEVQGFGAARKRSIDTKDKTILTLRGLNDEGLNDLHVANIQARVNHLGVVSHVVGRSEGHIRIHGLAIISKCS